jgi:hypothetical protein
MITFCLREDQPLVGLLKVSIGMLLPCIIWVKLVLLNSVTSFLTAIRLLTRSTFYRLFFSDIYY